jgi:GNAT superfamily N-acetyltransferase
LTDAEFVSRHLSDDDDLDTFTCGQPDLDAWLRHSARRAEGMRSGRTWVWARNGGVVAYFTLAGHVIERGNLPVRLGRGSPDRMPAVLIARLALAQSFHGRGLGGVLLADAASRIVAATDIVAARFVVVDAIDEPAATFYQHYGFTQVPETRRLVRKISDLAGDLRRTSSGERPRESVAVP